MTLRLSKFSGEIPRLIPRLLPDSYAQDAENTKLENGALMPIRRSRLEQRMTSVGQTIYKHRFNWMIWPGRLNVLPAPIANDRLYVFGDGRPKLLYNGNYYPMGVPGPTGAPAVGLVDPSQLDPDLRTDILYVYTWVTSLDEESKPSPLTTSLAWSPGLAVRLTGFEGVNTSRLVDRMRLYRSQTSELGETNLFLVQERPASTGEWLDYPSDNRLQEPLPSIDWDEPHRDLKGGVSMPNGIMAGFVSKTVFFSEPYLPHAWPEKYSLKVDYPIVGLGVFGSSLAILTTGQPYIATGITPDAMSMEKIATNLPCVAASSIVDLGDVVAYASPEGLVTVSAAGAQLVSRSLFTREQWNELSPGSFVSGQFGGRYMASYAHALPSGGERRGMIIIDLTGETPFLVRAGEDADAMFNEPGTGSLYLLRNGQDIWEWDALSEPYGEIAWRSKKYVLPGHTNYGAILIEGEDAITPLQQAEIDAKNAAAIARNRALISSGDTEGAVGTAAIGMVPIGGSAIQPVENNDVSIQVTVYADGRPVAVITQMNKVMRLPSGFLADTWEIEVRGNQMITAISLAASPSELAIG